MKTDTYYENVSKLTRMYHCLSTCWIVGVVAVEQKNSGMAFAKLFESAILLLDEVTQIVIR